MGFFDALDALLDPKKWYTPDNLVLYFRCEIDGSLSNYISKEKTTTNIKNIFADSIKREYPDANSWSREDTYSNIERYNDSVYKIEYRGTIKSIKNTYGDYLGEMYYNMVVYTNKYAELVSGDDFKTTIKIW